VAWPGGRWRAAASRRLISGTVSGIIPGVFRRSLVRGGGWRGLGIGTVFEQGGGDRTGGQGGHDERDVAGDRGRAPRPVAAAGIAPPGHWRTSGMPWGEPPPVSGRSVQPVKGRPACI